MSLLDVVVEFVVGGFSLNPYHCMVFSVISSRNIHATSSVILMKSPWLIDSRRVFSVIDTLIDYLTETPLFYGMVGTLS